MSSPATSDSRYVGGELELFATAHGWKAYLRQRLARFLGPGKRVLEVGAGIGATTRALCAGDEARWLCLEPDPALATRIPDAGLPRVCEIAVGALGSLGADERFDAVLYLDVLEHIEDDRAELALAATHLAPGGHVVVVVPAHQALYSPFDRAIGHFRRYDRRSLSALTPPGTALVAGEYLDAAGLLASAGNRLLLRSDLPTQAQIDLWDRWLVPISRRLDSLLGHRVGKSLLMAWRAADQGLTNSSNAPTRPAGR